MVDLTDEKMQQPACLMKSVLTYSAPRKAAHACARLRSLW